VSAASDVNPATASGLAYHRERPPWRRPPMATSRVLAFDCAPTTSSPCSATDGSTRPGSSERLACAPSTPSGRPRVPMHHSLGAWPVLFDDDTQIVEWNPPHRGCGRRRAARAAVVVIETSPAATVASCGWARSVAGVARRLPRFIWAPCCACATGDLAPPALPSEGRRRERDAGDETARPAVPHRLRAAGRGRRRGSRRGDGRRRRGRGGPPG
jgi:hypothetical protein